MSALGHILLVALGGGIGGAARFWVSGVVARRIGETFPFGTLVVNVSGAMAVGLLAAFILQPGIHPGAPEPVWSTLVVGMLGSYTTVSSFSLQTLALLRDRQHLRAALNALGSVASCLLAVAGGYMLGLGLSGAPGS